MEKKSDAIIFEGTKEQVISLLEEVNPVWKKSAIYRIEHLSSKNRGKKVRLSGNSLKEMPRVSVVTPNGIKKWLGL